MSIGGYRPLLWSIEYCHRTLRNWLVGYQRVWWAIVWYWNDWQMYGSVVLPCPHYLLPHCLFHCHQWRNWTVIRWCAQGFNRFQKSLGCLGLRLEKNVCSLDLSLYFYLEFLEIFRVIYRVFCFLKRLFVLRISWIMSLVSQGRSFLLGKIDVGMHSSMMLGTFSSNFTELIGCHLDQ